MDGIDPLLKHVANSGFLSCANLGLPSMASRGTCGTSSESNQRSGFLPPTYASLRHYASSGRRYLEVRIESQTISVGSVSGDKRHGAEVSTSSALSLRTTSLLGGWISQWAEPNLP